MRLPPPRASSLWLAHILHRLSGLALALFLPVHFCVLSPVLHDAARLDEFLRFSGHPAVKIAEFGLVFLLSVHAFGGLRLVALEWLPWPGPQKSLAAAALSLALLVAVLFLLQAY